ncbi:Glutamate receptor ionotropic, kainate 3 [Exaiptasia diaphana]|nr:Glutamate receptor ionotropic, kainate 3 [Exaiptasia diaphana]
MLEPFVYKTINNDSSVHYTGFLVDLLKKLAGDLKFSYEIHESLDGQYGLENNGEWNGMVRELIDGKADMIVSDLVVTEAAEKVIDFAFSYMYYTEVIAMKKIEIKTNDYLQFLMPFDAEVWIALVGALVVFTINLFAFNYFSPYGWKNEQGTKTSKEFSLFNCFWFSCSCMLQQGPEHTPKSISGFFWFTVLVWVSTYTANLAAFFTVVSKELPINNLEDAFNSNYQLGVSNRSYLVDFFKNTQQVTKWGA